GGGVRDGPRRSDARPRNTALVRHEAGGAAAGDRADVDVARSLREALGDRDRVAAVSGAAARRARVAAVSAGRGAREVDVLGAGVDPLEVRSSWSTVAARPDPVPA